MKKLFSLISVVISTTLSMAQIADVMVYADCSKNGYSMEIADVLSTSGRTSCNYVQLWAGGPKWATFNVGATITDYAQLTVGADPTTFYNYTEQAPYYNTANVGGLYAWNNPNLNGRKTTWTSSVSTGISDVATTLWGSNWKTPTKAQLDTLQNNTYGKTTWTRCDGSTTQYVAGCTLKGYKVSGVGDYANYSIFLPTVGYFDCSDGTVSHASIYGVYWSSTEFDSYYAYGLDFFYSSNRKVEDGSRGYGLSVRAVLDDNAGTVESAENVTLSLYAQGCDTANMIICPIGQQMRISAVETYGYHFTQWSDGNTTNPRVVTMNSNATYTAQFAKNLYTITTAANDSVRGVVLGDTTVEYLETISISATPNYGYLFTKWNDGNTSNPRQVQVTEDKTYTAQFDKNTYYITKIANSTFGQVGGSSSALYLDEVSLSVSSNCGAYFTQWSDGNTDNPRLFSITQDTTFEAQFALYYSGQCGDNATWQYANDTLTISGTGALYGYTSTTMPWVLLRDNISAIVLDSGITSIGEYCFYGCSLVKEITFGEQLTSIGSYSFAGCNNIRSITCLASSLVSIQSTTMNDVSNYAKVNVPPMLEEDYQFDTNWRRFVIVPMGNMFTVTASATNGSVTGAGKYLENSSVTLTATANTGYHFTQWNDGNMSNPLSIVVTTDTTFEALFAKNVYSITTAVNDPARGVVQGDTTTAEYLETISISATANYGYHFTQWNDSNTNNPRQVKVIGDKTYTAQFDKNQYTVSTSKDANTALVTAGGTYNYLDEIVLSAIANVNFQFDDWSDGNTDNPRTLIVTQDTFLTAFSSKIRSGKCGNNLTWNYSNGILVISGTEEMYDYTQDTAPWMALYKDSITDVVINNGCTSIGSFAFYGLHNRAFTSLVLPQSVETIGAYAFANCNRLTSISLPASLLEISNYAFSGCISVDNITSLATTRPDIYENTFKDVSSYAYLYVPCDYKRSYQLNAYWNRFDLKCIGAEETTVTNDNVTVNPNENDAAFTWPTNTQAASYSLQITKDGVVFCTLTFNSLGQLIGLAFAPGRGAAMEATEQAAIQSGNGFTFTVTGLNSASAYAFNMKVKDSGNQTIKSYTGTFQTKGTIITDLDNQIIDSPVNRFTKIIKDGYLLIQRDGKTYNAQGGEVR